MVEMKWYDWNAKDNPAFLKALAETRRLATREGWCYPQAITVAIDQYAEAGDGHPKLFPEYAS